MSESPPPAASSAGRPEARGDSKTLSSSSDSKPSSTGTWLSVAAMVLALTAIGLTQFDLFQIQPLQQHSPRSDEAVAVAAAQSDARPEPSTDSPSADAPASAAAPSRPQPASRVRLIETPLDLPLEAMREEAEYVATRLEKALPDKPESLHVAALFYAQTRQTAEAEKRWSRCIELAPQVEMYYINLAALLMERGENEQAVKTLKAALDAGYSSPAMMHHWGLALSNAGRFEEAIPVIEKLLEEDPQNAAQWLILGKAQLETGELEDAEESLRQAIELGNRTHGAYFALGTTYARLGKREEAKEYLQKYQETRPDKSDSTQERLEQLNVNEMRQTALLVLSEAASVYLRGDQAFDAERLLLRALAYDPNALGPAQMLARMYFDKQMLAEERVVRERIVKIDPYNFASYVDCAKVSAQLGDMATAEAMLKIAMTQRPDAVEPYATLAEFHWQAGSLPEARWFAEQAVERQPRAEGYRLLAAICEAQKDAKAYQQALQQAEQLSKKAKP